MPLDHSPLQQLVPNNVGKANDYQAKYEAHVAHVEALGQR